MNKNTPINDVSQKRKMDARAEETIEWIVEYNSGEMDEARFEELKTWLSSDPENVRIWKKLENGLTPFDIVARSELPTHPLSKAIMDRPQPRRQALRGIAAIGAVFGLTALGVNRFVPLDLLASDKVTGTGEQAFVPLDGGGDITLAPRTAVNFGKTNQSMQLVSGQIYARLDNRATGFDIHAADMVFSNRGGNFQLAHQQKRTTVISLKGKTTIKAQNAHFTEVRPGEQISFENGRATRQWRNAEEVSAWTRKLLIVKDKPVAEIVAQLRPYFPGVIRVSPQAASLPVSGVFRLDNPAQALETIATSLDLQFHSLGDYWITLDTTSI